MINKLLLRFSLFMVYMLAAFRAFRPAARFLQQQQPRGLTVLKETAAGRVYLNVPFEDKEAVKLKGGRWDADEKKWYYEESAGKEEDFAKWSEQVEHKWLNVPFADKDEAKARGARWDKERKRWYAPAGVSEALFRAWLVPAPAAGRNQGKSGGKAPFVDTGKYVLLLDVETSGLPPSTRGQYPSPDSLAEYAQARVLKVSAARCILPGLHEKDALSLIVKADGFRITNAQFHGITDAVSQRQGVPFSEVARKLHRMLEGCVAVVAHNVDFDLAVLKSELYRHSCADALAQLQACRKLCTMELSKNAVGLKNIAGNPKNPTLRELYAYAVGAEKAASVQDLGLEQLKEAFGVLVEKKIIGKDAME